MITDFFFVSDFHGFDVMWDGATCHTSHAIIDLLHHCVLTEVTAPVIGSYFFENEVGATIAVNGNIDRIMITEFFCILSSWF